MSAVEDFEAINAALKQLEAKKPSSDVTEGKEWVDAVYGMYGYPKSVPDDMCAVGPDLTAYYRRLEQLADALYGPGIYAD